MTAKKTNSAKLDLHTLHFNIHRLISHLHSNKIKEQTKTQQQQNQVCSFKIWHWYSLLKMLLGKHFILRDEDSFFNLAQEFVDGLALYFVIGWTVQKIILICNIIIIINKVQGTGNRYGDDCYEILLSGLFSTITVIVTVVTVPESNALLCDPDPLVHVFIRHRSWR